MTKKKPIVKSPALQEKEQYNAFLQRFKNACDLMAGPGFFEQLPKHHLPQLFSQRLPPLKLEFAPGVLTKEQETHWQQQFRLRLTDLSIKTLPTKPCRWQTISAKAYCWPIMQVPCQKKVGVCPFCNSLLARMSVVLSCSSKPPNGS